MEDSQKTHSTQDAKTSAKIPSNKKEDPKRKIGLS